MKTKATFICHKDFENIKPINVFFKELEGRAEEGKPPHLNRHIIFRKKCLLGKYEKVMLKVTADDYFKFYINGKLVMQGPPQSYPTKYYYMEIDVSKYVKEGENVFSSHVYYQGLINHVWITADNRSMFWCELWVDDKIVLVSDESWKCADHTGYSSCGRFGYNTAFAERYDSRAKEKGFENLDFDDSHWENARVYKNADYKLVKSEIKPLDVYEVEPVVQKEKDNVVFFDFGQEMVGYLFAKAKGNDGDKVILRFGEELNEDGSVRFDMRCNCLYQEEWILSGKNDTLSQFDYKAFRYVEILCPNSVNLECVKMQVRHYPYKKVNFYNIDNEKLNSILKLCENTIHYGVQEAYLDCPTREKGQYLGDLAVSGRAHVALTMDTTLIKKALKDFCESTFVCKGMLAVTTSTLNQEIADYSLLFPAIALWVYKVDGDEESLRYFYHYVKGIKEYFLEYADTCGLLSGVKEKWNLVDWPPNLRDDYDFPLDRPIKDGLHNVINAFWVGFLQAEEEIAKILSIKNESLLNKVKKSFIDAFFDNKTKLFCDSINKTHSSVHSNVLPLLFEIGVEDKEVKNNIVRFIKEKKLTSMGVYMAYFALAALKKNGYEQEAISLATDEKAWLNMIKEGATTTFEAWGKEQKWNTSLFHPWAVAPLIIFTDCVEPY